MKRLFTGRNLLYRYSSLLAAGLLLLAIPLIGHWQDGVLPVLILAHFALILASVVYATLVLPNLYLAQHLAYAGWGLLAICWLNAGLLLASPLHTGLPQANGGLQLSALLLGQFILAWSALTLITKQPLTNTRRSLARLQEYSAAVIFGIGIIYLWQLIVTTLAISPILLPSPAQIWLRLSTSSAILWADFVQTFIKAVLAGYVIGNAAGLLVAVLTSRYQFLQRGILPLGNFISALPIIGIAPIMVMWFGFDWQSKAAVVAVMTFFPMLVNAVSGLNSADRILRELLAGYGANYRQVFVKLLLPSSLPFIFNGLKINCTLALIGAIVAEFFGTPIVGMGFRISTEVGRLNIDMVWAEIAVAAVTGSLFYLFVAGCERMLTFWHPSQMRKL